MKYFLQIGLGVVAVLLAILFFTLDPANSPVFPKCIFHATTGYYCPGCGSQRAIHSLLHLNFMGVVKSNFLFLPAGLLIVYHYSRCFINKKLNWKLPNIFYFKNTPWIILGVIIVFWILRNLSFNPFVLLAPS